MVWLQKKIYLPIELVGSRGNNMTKAYEHIEETSLIEQRFSFTTVPKPRGESIKQWKLFLEWIKQQQPHTAYNFGKND